MSASKPFDLVVFDWDGTLMDSAAAIVLAIQSASRDLGIPTPSEEASRHVIGLGLLEALRYLAPGMSGDWYREMAERYRHHYFSHDHDIALFAGARELLADLRAAGFTLAVATGKTRAGLDRALDYFMLQDFFAATRTSSECPSKPHPAMLLELMDELSVAPDRVVMIGDTTHDLYMANNAGCRGVGVTYGAHPKSELVAANPVFCADSVRELAKWCLAK
ncbi:MAG: HAD-IA family hydrolase [Zoogloeaceae bacterium]|jgi:phosphoglycolate phosphatase|nr:HAD-IA family hydrolase [Zoogloeaceae bacterium]